MASSMNCVFSIIIPAYNCADTLRRCLTSILSQQYDNMEVLIIDDGSTDSTPEICDEYSSADSRIKVFHKINGGVSSARNVGIENALGQWMLFVDSDDVLADNALHLLQRAILNQNACLPDLIISNVMFVYKGEKTNILYESELESLDELYGSGCWGAVWNKVFSTYVVHNHFIRFDESLHFSEDCLFLAHYCKYVDGINYINDVCYHQYLPESYFDKYKQYNTFSNDLFLYSKIKQVNSRCANALVDGLVVSALRKIKSSRKDAKKCIRDLQSVVGVDINHALGKSKILIRSLSHCGSTSIWYLVFILHSLLPI